jgi:hypothetical protein
LRQENRLIPLTTTIDDTDWATPKNTMHLINTRKFKVCSWMLAALLATGCQKQAAPDPYLAALPESPASVASQPATADTPTPGPTFVGTPVAAPTQGAAAESGSVKSDVSTTQQSNSMPLPGQANDHSNPEPKPTEKQNPKDVKK